MGEEPRGPDSLPKTGNSRGIQFLPGGRGEVWGVHFVVEVGMQVWDLSHGGTIEAPPQGLPISETEALV